MFSFFYVLLLFPPCVVRALQCSPARIGEFFSTTHIRLSKHVLDQDTRAREAVRSTPAPQMSAIFHNCCHRRPGESTYRIGASSPCLYCLRWRRREATCKARTLIGAWGFFLHNSKRVEELYWVCCSSPLALARAPGDSEKSNSG
jgi:hypothetical protein